MSEQDEKTERRLRTALHAAGSEAPAPADLWVRIKPRLEGSTTTSTWWQRRWASLAVGAAATVVLTVGATGIVLVAAGLTAGNGDGLLVAGDENSFNLAIRSDDSAGLPDVDDGTTTRLSRWALEEEQSGALVVPAPQPTGTPAPSIVWGPAGSPGPVGTRGPAPSPSGDAQDFPVFNSERQVISQASLTVEVEDVGTAITELRAFVESVGGFIEHVSMRDGPQPGRGSATIRVPAEQFNHTIDRIEAFGEVLGQSLGQTDVTGDAIDLAAQLRSERSAEASLLKLLDRAVSVSDVLTVERELGRVRANVERLQGQLDFIERSVALATITVTFALPPDPTASAPSASLRIEVRDVERSVRRIRDLVDQAGGTMGQVVTVSTQQDGQEAFLSFLVPASAFDSVLTSLVGDGVVLHQEVRSDGRLPKDKPDEDAQARITTELQSPEEANPWRSIGIPVGGALVVLSLVGALTLAFRARRRV
jgi:hypothetical protein